MVEENFLRVATNIGGKEDTWNLDISNMTLTELLKLRTELDGEAAVLYLDKLLYQEHKIGKEMRRYYNDIKKENKFKKRRKLKWKYRRDK